VKSPSREVVVVGGGPVGAAAALALTRRNFRTLLIEPAKPVHATERLVDELRFYALSPASVDFLRELDVWNGALAQRAGPFACMRVWDREPTRELVFEARDISRAELGWIVDHGALTEALWSALGASQIRRARVQSFVREDDCTTVQIEGEDSLSCELLVGADGAQSPLRQLAGIDVTAWAYPQQALVANVACELGHAQTAWQRFLPGGPLAFLPMRDGHCSIVWSLPLNEVQGLLDCNDDAFSAALQAASQERLGGLRVIGPRRSFPLHWSHAQDYVRPGFALVGDAAHTIHPLAGQGLNLGLADVRELAVTLEAARAAGRAWSAQRTLERYQRARQAGNLEMAALTDALFRTFNWRAPGWDGLRDWGLGAITRVAPLRAFFAHQAAGL
jgi:ubiquinone biosynthesis UbiH/UbiF/VisC/COQ6 family hydroxylase